MTIHRTLAEDSQGYGDFGTGFVKLLERICKTFGEDLPGFARLWERIYQDL